MDLAVHFLLLWSIGILNRSSQNLTTELYLKVPKPSIAVLYPLGED